MEIPENRCILRWEERRWQGPLELELLDLGRL